jgi:hypothetical protein
VPSGRKGSGFLNPTECLPPDDRRTASLMPRAAEGGYVTFVIEERSKLRQEATR